MLEDYDLVVEVPDSRSQDALVAAYRKVFGEEARLESLAGQRPSRRRHATRITPLTAREKHGKGTYPRVSGL